ncbi:hypothetical protein DESC_970030 [Desulfosarcina cetonica]|nr:hypothetical protein DESC_970030 [Desulfosarcina cetonica]
MRNLTLLANKLNHAKKSNEKNNI